MLADNQRIFVSIAAYRDAQLVPTVEDLLARAQEPALLRFGICWQHAIGEPRLPFQDDERFQVIDVDWRESQGACWARAEIMKLWQGEQWFLQIDSHCRFIDHWDTKLIRMIGQTGSNKAILSTYANGFTPTPAGTDSREVLTGSPQLIALEGFSAEGLPLLKPLAIPNVSDRRRPAAARFLGAGFIFAPGSFVEEVPYDPELYFFGEEISMTLRAFTSGYDLFHPIENVVWHDYVRAYASRHWDDHASPERAEIDMPSSVVSTRDRASRRKVRRLLLGESSEDVGLSISETNPAVADRSSLTSHDRYALGSVRTREDYERYAGLSFKLRKLQDYARYAYDPPNPDAPSDWPDRIYTWLVRISVDVAALSPGALDERSFWVVAVQDAEQREIRRHDFQRSDISFSGSETSIILVCEIQSGIIPVSWSVLPFSRAFGWGRKLHGTLTESDFSIIND